ncbi:hypothetical protein ACL5HQ_07800 [Stenotrophomonas maltophilia]|uniref:hypothetical protein n=2 Tax=Stenotrophomonas TaxID=40323 RepID=UPI001EF77B50|nr:hypothetical protein [Stenotrophomonas maltophilia]
MPLVFRASPAFWMFAFLIWLLLVSALIHAGFQPDHWQQPDTVYGVVPYPTGSVISFALIILAEIVAMGLIVQPWRFGRLWLRMQLGIFQWLAWTAYWSAISMHQSPVRGVHLLWLIAASAILLLALFVIVPASLWPRLRRWLGS